MLPEAEASEIASRLSMAPSDASPHVLSRVHFVTEAKGGYGAAREMVEYILTGLGLWEKALKAYLP